MANTVSVKKLVADISNLEVYSGEQYLEERQITTEDISRPGLELLSRRTDPAFWNDRGLIWQ